MDINELRQQIDGIDCQLVDLYCKRMDIARAIGRYKQENNLPVVQPQQWQQVCKRYLKPGQDIQYQEFIEEFLQILHLHSIKKQQS